MTWTSPATPVGGTAITVAFYNTNLRDNLNHLRGFMPDPSSGNQVLQSNSTTTGAWTNTPSFTSLTLSGALTMGGLFTIQNNDITLQRVTNNSDQPAVRWLSTGGADGYEVYLVTNTNALNFDRVGTGTLMHFPNAGGVTIDAAATMASTLGVTGAATMSSSLTVQGTATHNGTATFNSGITFTAALTATSATYSSTVTATRHIASTGNSAGSPSFQVTAGYGIYAQSASSLTFAANSAIAGEVTNSGNLAWQFAMSATAFNVVPSDRRAKTNIVPVTRSVHNELRNVPVVSYELNRDGSKHIGIVAQDLQRDFPEIVTENNEADGHDDMLGIDLVGFCAMLLRGQQELAERIDALGDS